MLLEELRTGGRNLGKMTQIPEGRFRPKIAGRTKRMRDKRVGIAALLVLWWGIHSAAGKMHPSLVDPQRTNCLTCHQVTAQNQQTHAPVQTSCLSCHRFEKTETGLNVSLVKPQPDLCLSCHARHQAAASGTWEAAHPPVTDQCTSCHRPHSSAQPSLLREAVPALCLSCHDGEAINGKHGMPVAKSGCTRCHTPHGSTVKGMLRGAQRHAPFAEGSCNACHRKGLGGKTLLKAQGSALCFACHGEFENLPKNSVVHGAVEQGRCVACHDPHVAANAKLLARQGPELCQGCHTAVAAKASAKSSHPPLADDCLSCHSPHSSQHSGLLASPEPQLCANCHDLEDKGFQTKHLGEKGQTLPCLGCHDPHGSGSEHLIADAATHPPFGDGSCDACHEKGGTVVEGGSRRLCFACHSDWEERASKAPHIHGAVDAGECVACHTPHASTRAFLLKSSSVRVCGGCHSDQLPAAGEKPHGAIAALGCPVCHQPHSGGEKFLREEPTKLCLVCHLADAGNLKNQKLFGLFPVSQEQLKLWGRLRLTPDNSKNHPVTGHRVLGTPTEEELERASTSFRGELSCLTCHDPHKGAGRGLARRDAQGKPVTCDSCHAK